MGGALGAQRVCRAVTDQVRLARPLQLPGACGLLGWAGVNDVFPSVFCPHSFPAKHGGASLRTKCFLVHLTTTSIIICEP